MKWMRSQLTWMSALALLMATTVGCNCKQVTSERNALFAQNQKLQELLTKSYAANDSLVAERDRLNAEMLSLQQASQQVQEQVQEQVQDTGFGQIQGVETVAGEGTITVRVPGDVLFAPGKISLKTSARKTLDEIANVIERQYPTNTIRVVGYTDTDPIRKSKWVDNLQLSQERAATVHRYLQQQKIAPEAMEAVGKGQWHPRGTKALSRRVEIVVVLSE